MSSHPSFLALDQLSLGSGSEETSSHAASCPRCQQYVQSLKTALPIPSWLEEQKESAARRWWSQLTQSRSVLAFGVALTLCLIAVPSIRKYATDSGVRAKAASPSVALYVKRGERVGLWDGQMVLRPGDLVRLGIASEGYRFVRVSSSRPDGHSMVLYQGELSPSGNTLLPAGWRLDSDGTTENLIVTLSDGPDAAPSWSTRLSIQKTGQELLP